MTLVESPAAPATTMMATMPAGRSRSSSPTLPRRRSPSPSPSRRDGSPSAGPSCKGKENEGRDSQQPDHHPLSLPKHSHSSVDDRRASPSPSHSPSCSSSSRKRRLDRGEDDGHGAEGAETTTGPFPATYPPPFPAAAASTAADAAIVPDNAAGTNMDDVASLLGSNSQQRRPRRNSMSHHHDHNRSASPSPGRHEGGPAGEEEEAQGQQHEEQARAREEKQEHARAHEEERSSRRELEDSRCCVGVGEGEAGGSDENWDVPCGFNEVAKRTLRIEYWDRTRECKERKWDHMDHIDATYPSREAWIWQSVLHEEEVVLEPNMFPYNTPRGIEHWTLWARRELALAEVEAYVLGWVARERPEVTRWNLDENAQRSIDIYHVHVYFQVCPDEEVGPPPPREPRRFSREEEEEEQKEAEAGAQAEAGGQGEGEGGPAAKRPCRRRPDDDGQQPEQEQQEGESVATLGGNHQPSAS